ncbi:MAG: AbrB/MazE/SpoVT family DNA-binding domain-containing protein [Candidatus Korobacteraceae bacterium]
MPIKTELIRIGNSRGIRIPKPIIEQCRLGDTVELRVQDDSLIISSQHKPRQGWEEALRRATPATEDELLLNSVLDDDFDREEWTW